MNDIMMNLQQLVGSSNEESSQNSNAENFLKPFLSSPTFKKVLEVLVIQTFDHILKPTLENSIRKVVKHELELELAEKRFLVSKRNPEKEIQPPKQRRLRLKFLTKVSVPVLTGVEIKGEGGTAIEVVLIGDTGGEIIDSGPEAFAKLEIVVIRGDFGDESGENWTSEEFCSNIVRDREANKSLLAETVHVKLNKGIGIIDKIKFTHSSSYMKKNVFCLGARFVNSFRGTQVKEAKTEPFTVKDARQLYNEKRDPPSLSDGVHRLKNIGTGSRRRLRVENVHTVEDFLVLLLTDPERLKSVLNLRPSMWGETTSHARRCILKDRMYCYTDSQQNSGVAFNVVGEVLGVIRECQYQPTDILSESNKANARMMLVSACQDWDRVVPFDDKTSFLKYLPQLSPSQLSPSRMNVSFQASISSARGATAINVDDFGSNSSIYSPGIPDFCLDDVNISFDELMFGHDTHQQSAATTNLTFVPSHNGSIVQDRWKMLLIISRLLSILRRSSMRRRDAAVMDHIHVCKKQKIL